MKGRLWISGIVAPLLLTGCAQDQSAGVKQLQAELTTANEKLTAIESRLDMSEMRLDTKDMEEHIARLAFLKPGDDGYSVIRYDLGTLTVQLDDVRSFASGSRVTLKFGNVLSADVAGLNGTIEWGELNKDGRPDNASAKSKEFAFANELRAGAWTKITITLDGTPPAKVGFIRIRDVTHRGIKLTL